MKRVVNKRDISEPTFVMATTRVPTHSLPHPHGGADVSNGLGQPPPLPPLNPRRRQDGPRPRAEFEDGGIAPPNLPFANNKTNSVASSDYNEDNRSAFSVSDEDEKSRSTRRKLRKEDPNVSGRGPPGMGMGEGSQQHVARGAPPASRTAGAPGPRAPGGMF